MHNVTASRCALLLEVAVPVRELRRSGVATGDGWWRVKEGLLVMVFMFAGSVGLQSSKEFLWEESDAVRLDGIGRAVDRLMSLRCTR